MHRSEKEILCLLPEGNADQKERESKQEHFPAKKNNNHKSLRDGQMKPKAAAAQEAVTFTLKILRLRQGS